MSPQDQIESSSAAQPDGDTPHSERHQALKYSYDDPDLELAQTQTKVAVFMGQMSVHQAPALPKRPFSSLRTCQTRKCLLALMAILEIALAPAIYVAGMIAEHEESWKPLFMVLFAGWTILLVLGICIDLYPLRIRSIDFIKRAFWHLGSCILMLYIVSTAQATADALPRELPLIIDCGLGVSVGIQSLPSNIRRNLWRGFNEVAGSFCGGVQVRFRGREREPNANEEQ